MKPKFLLEDFLYEEHFRNEKSPLPILGYINASISSLFPTPATRTPQKYGVKKGLLKTIGFSKAGSYTLISEGTLAGGRLTSHDSCLTEDF